MLPGWAPSHTSVGDQPLRLRHGWAQNYCHRGTGPKENLQHEMRTSSDVLNENFLQTVADILRNSELPGPLEALER